MSDRCNSSTNGYSPPIQQQQHHHHQTDPGTSVVVGYRRRSKHSTDRNNKRSVQQQQQQRQQKQQQSYDRNNTIEENTKKKTKKKKILLLHGNRQTGQLLLGRIERFRKKLLQQYNIDIVAIDAPYLYDDCDTNDNTTTMADTATAINQNDNNDTVDDVIQQQQQQQRTWWKRSNQPKNDTTSSSSNNNNNNNDSNQYIGLEETVRLIQSTWMGSCDQHLPDEQQQQSLSLSSSSTTTTSSSNQFIGIMGFSQGARLVHLLSILHHIHNYNNNHNSILTTTKSQQQQVHDLFLPGLQFVIMVSGYDAPIPNNLFHYQHDNNNNNNSPSQQEQPKQQNDSCSDCQKILQSLVLDGVIDMEMNIQPSGLKRITIPNLHIWGERDRLVLGQQSESVTHHYNQPTIHIHDGGHHIPMRAADVQVYLNFIKDHYNTTNTEVDRCTDNNNNNNNEVAKSNAAALGGHHIDMTTSKAPIFPMTNHVNHLLHPVVEAIQIKNENDVVVEEIVLQVAPDEECAIQQQDEIEALEAIYSNDFHLLSTKSLDDTTSSGVKYQYPITYMVNIYPTSDDNGAASTFHGTATNCKTKWPPCPISIHVVYPPNYPNTKPVLSIVKSNNDDDKKYIDRIKPLTSTVYTQCIEVMYEAASTDMEYHTPCIMTCLLAAKEYFDEAPLLEEDDKVGTNEEVLNDSLQNKNAEEIQEDETVEVTDHDLNTKIKSSSNKRIRECNLQGLQIAEQLVRIRMSSSNSNNSENNNGVENLYISTGNSSNGKGGSWMFTIGLVGKPSAGKSTFFNTATGFARQRQQTNADGTDQNNNSKSNKSIPDPTISLSTNAFIGGAAMAPHPFTTISPNVGYCLVPAPDGSCPEDSHNVSSEKGDDISNVGSTHGRDNKGRRFVPVLLKDVAGLVPGAYQGRGRGNQFLSDLCDADVLIHVCDASGIADQEGNMIMVSSEQNGSLHDKNSGSDPLEDMAWIRNELIEWVYTNLIRKWDTIQRKGRSKLEGMFSGYGQPMSMTNMILNAVEKFMMTQQYTEPNQTIQFTNPYEQMDEWDTGDIYRLVSAFLGVRFPIAVALNKIDIPSSSEHVEKIMKSLPIHGTHVATPLSAKSEMEFAQHYIEAVMCPGGVTDSKNIDSKPGKMSIPSGTWHCLQSAIQLYDPILMFPVVDHQTYAPLPGLFRYASSDPSLPSHGMIECIKAAGGIAPSEWDTNIQQYNVPKMNGNKKKANQSNSSKNPLILRDALMMKPGSTVYDVYNTLKRLGAMSGEFVRAEASNDLYIPAKPVPKFQLLSKQIRIIKIMTNKRQSWQNS